MNCDGYDAPEKTADGMNTLRGLLGDTNANGARAGAIPLGAVGLKACDAAFTDPRLLPSFWARRAHLYQAKALHQMALGNFADALKELDASDAQAAGHSDVWFDDSMGLANRIIRGVVLYRLDRKDEGRAVLAAAAAARPYAPSVGGLVRSVRMVYEYDRDSFTRLLTDGAPVSPPLIQVLFWTAIFHDDFAAADRLSGQISFDIPKGHGSWRPITDHPYEYTLIKERAQIAGGLAYAKLALGNGDDARKVIADARDDIADAIEPPKPAADGTPPNKKALREWDLRKQAGAEATKELDTWEHAMMIRSKVAGTSLAAATVILEAEKNDPPSTITDILRQVKPANDAERKSIAGILERIEASKDRSRRSSFALNLSQLVTRLPRPETVSMRPTIQREGIGILRSDANGFAVRPDKDSGQATVRFGSTSAPRAMVEELSILKAAQYALSQGKDAFIITASQSIQRSTTIVGWGAHTYDSGYESRLMVRPVASTAIPADLANQRWRLIKADAVIAKLGPKYLSTDQAQ